MNSLVVIWLCFGFAVGTSLLNEEGDPCIDDDNNAGICRIISKCNSAQHSLKNQKHPKICGYTGVNDIVVCCVTSSATNMTAGSKDNGANQNEKIRQSVTRSPGEISKAKCKEYAQYSYSLSKNKKIYDCDTSSDFSHNFKASPKEFPHMVHIGYMTPEGIVYQCAGNLISEYFVLTVAHCITNPHVGPPVRVRVGITDIDDTEHRQELNIAKTFVYPDAENRYHDIALVKLEKPVRLNSYVRPACLNTVRNIDYQEVLVSGWGTSEQGGNPSETLTKGIVNIVSYEECNKHYEHSARLKNGIVDDWMVCAAIKTGKDTCQGDSGVPLQIRVQDSEDMKCMFSILGLTSFGKTCGVPSIPSVYIRVSYYVKWIENIVWPV